MSCFYKAFLFAFVIAMPMLSQAGKDYYAILGVSQNAGESELKAAYRKLAMKYHPDRMQGESNEAIKNAESKFKEIKEAYEFLSDETQKQHYDHFERNARSSLDQMNELKIFLGELSNARTTEEVVKGLSKIDIYRDFIYQGNHEYSLMDGYSEAANLVIETFQRMIDRGQFDSFDAVRALLQRTASWRFHEDNTTYTKTIWWEPLQSKLLQRLPLRGYSLTDLLSVLKNIPISAEVEIDERIFGKETRYVNRGSRYAIGEDEARVLIGGLLEAKKIQSAQVFFDNLRQLSAITTGRYYQKNVLFRGLEGHVSYVLPFLHEMTSSQLVDTVIMASKNPVELLGLLENILEQQRKDRRLSAEELTTILKTAAGYSLNDKFATPAKFFSGITEYMLAHKGYTKDTLNFWIKDLRAGPYKDHMGIDDDYLRNKLIFTQFQTDLFDLIKKYKDTLKTEKVSSEQWNAIRSALFISKVKFEAQMFVATFARKTTYWQASMPQAKTKITETTWLAGRSIRSDDTLLKLQGAKDRGINQCSKIFSQM